MFKIVLSAAALSIAAGVASASLPSDTTAGFAGLMILAYDQDGTGHNVAVGSEGSNYDQDGTGVAAVQEGDVGVKVATGSDGGNSAPYAAVQEGSVGIVVAGEQEGTGQFTA